MKNQILGAAAFLTTISLTATVQAANSEHVRQLLATKQCQNCDLSGASLFGVNLSEAKFNGANLTGADLRNSFLANAELTGAYLNGANFQGAVGIPLQIASPEEFYAWGIAEGEKGNQQQAISYFNQAIAIKPEYAGAYLARGVARYQILDRQGAFQDAQIAEKLFTSQNNSPGTLTTQAFIKELQTPVNDKVSTGSPSFVDFFGSLSSILLQLLPF
jgi:tetratricopeptide (TPR) repeat protein